MEDFIGKIGEEFMNLEFALADLLKVIFIFALIWGILFFLKKFLKNPARLVRFDLGSKSAIYQIIKYVFLFLGFTSVLGIFGINITGIIVASSALLVGVGLGLQQTFNDLFSGFIILFEGTIHVTDVVEVDGTVGRVQEIGIRTSKVRTREDKILIIPNSKFIVDNVNNWSYDTRKTRFHVSTRASYGTDPQLVEKAILDAIKDNPEVSADPEPYVWFTDFGKSSLDFSLYFWTENTFRVERLQSDLRFAIAASFKQHGIKIPFPQRDLHIKTMGDTFKMEKPQP